VGILHKGTSPFTVHGNNPSKVADTSVSNAISYTDLPIDLDVNAIKSNIASNKASNNKMRFNKFKDIKGSDLGKTVNIDRMVVSEMKTQNKSTINNTKVPIKLNNKNIEYEKNVNLNEDSRILSNIKSD